MDSYDVHVHSIKFQLYDKESFNISKNIFKYNTILNKWKIAETIYTPFQNGHFLPVLTRVEQLS